MYAGMQRRPHRHHPHPHPAGLSPMQMQWILSVVVIPSIPFREFEREGSRERVKMYAGDPADDFHESGWDVGN